MRNYTNCRHCATPLQHTFLDLGFAPPSNAYLSVEDLAKPEKYYPLKVKVCTNCWLVQTEDYAQADELFSADYAYFSSTSSGWLAQALLPRSTTPIQPHAAPCAACTTSSRHMLR